MQKILRCFGNDLQKKFYTDYHDHEWGIASYNDRYLFEMLCLEGAQAGLSWEIILKKRQNYQKAFYNFNPHSVSLMQNSILEKLLSNKGIIRNRRKIFSIRNNAHVFLSIQRDYKSFSNYLWGFVNNKPIINQWKNFKDVPSETTLSKLISKELKKRGMTFVGPKIIYSFMQATGIVNDHIENCSFKRA